MWTSKIGRAKQLKEDLEKALKSFFDSHPYQIDTKIDAQTKRLVYYVTKADEVPEEIALITGDIIQNLRSSLDHLAYKLFTVGPNHGMSGRHIYFPIADDFNQYENEKRRKTDGLAQQAKDLIDAIKPYRGGNDSLWKIHKLNIIDKHRLLVTVGSAYDSLDLGAHVIETMNRAFPDLKVPAISFFMKPADRSFPLKVGDELLMDGPDAEPIPNMQFRFSIVLNEPGIVEGEPILEMLQAMIDSVDSLVPRFEPHYRIHGLGRGYMLG